MRSTFTKFLISSHLSPKQMSTHTNCILYHFATCGIVMYTEVGDYAFYRHSTLLKNITWYVILFPASLSFFFSFLGRAIMSSEHRNGKRGPRLALEEIYSHSYYYLLLSHIIWMIVIFFSYYFF